MFGAATLTVGPPNPHRGPPMAPSQPDPWGLYTIFSAGLLPMTSWGCGVTWSPWSSLGSKVPSRQLCTYYLTAWQPCALWRLRSQEQGARARGARVWEAGAGIRASSTIRLPSPHRGLEAEWEGRVPAAWPQTLSGTSGHSPHHRGRAVPWTWGGRGIPHKDPGLALHAESRGLVPWRLI